MALKTVVLTPYRPHPQRDHNWRFVEAWIRTNYGFPLFTSDSIGFKFSVAQARNRAAGLAGNWDVAVFHDADTVAHPEAVTEAVRRASECDKMVVAADSHMYCDRFSSQRIVFSGVPMFGRPDKFDNTGVYAQPCSGVFAVNRNVWEATGGYVESLAGWGFEDLVFLQSCGLFAQGHEWVRGHITLHLWHPPAPRDADTQSNKAAWQTLARFRRRNDVDGARKYLESLGHRVP